jgi:catechol 2,3-dioxygenase-like lactoylglutathione lyase family enzyme
MYPQLHTVGLVVQDMAKSLDFYRCLGLNIAPGEEKSPHVEFNGPNGYNMGFVSQAMVKQTDPKWADGFGNRINLQFAFAKPEDVDGAHERLIGAGYASYQAPWDAFWGQRFARVIDPDQNVVNLFADLHP